MMFAARAAKTAGVNRKSYVIQTPLTLHRLIAETIEAAVLGSQPC